MHRAPRSQVDGQNIMALPVKMRWPRGLCRVRHRRIAGLWGKINDGARVAEALNLDRANCADWFSDKHVCVIALRHINEFQQHGYLI